MKDLTVGNVKKTVLLFAVPYLISSFMQTFYGLVDLFVVGLYNEKETSAAVANGGQVIHMVTVIIVGIAMGTTVKIGIEYGQKKYENVRKTIGLSIWLFSIIAVILSVTLFAFTNQITKIMLTPDTAVKQTVTYLRICFVGIPFIVAYNVISAIFRGLGDTKSPMYFVAVACVINIILDFVFVGILDLGAAGAALGTVCGQAGSVLFSLIAILRKNNSELDLNRSIIKLNKKSIRFDKEYAKGILKIGIPISLQDGLIQVAFICITVIANNMGIVAATSVGIVEKIIGFLFLVPSAFLAAISTITAHNIGANKIKRTYEALRFGLMVTVTWGLVCAFVCNIAPGYIVGIFTKDAKIISSGSDYLRTYSFDTMFAAMHFCFSGYFCGCQRSIYSFVHNIISIVTIRIPLAYISSQVFGDNLFYMGIAAPLGSLLSAIICVGLFVYIKRAVVMKS